MKSAVATQGTLERDLANDLILALDPVAFAEAAGIEPDPWQARLLRSTSKRLLLCCSRQAGKSSTVALLALHTILYEPGALVLVASPSQRQSGELFKKLLAVYRGLGKPVPSDTENALSLELENGSRVAIVPGHENTVRGYSGVRLLIIDEASKVSDDLYRTVRPMLAVSGGRLALLSTPFGRRGFYWEEYQDRANWDFYEIPASECPRISPEFLEEERRKLGPLWFASEYLCQFVDQINSLFPSELIDAAFSDDIAPLFADGSSAGAPTWSDEEDSIEPLCFEHEEDNEHV